MWSYSDLPVGKLLSSQLRHPWLAQHRHFHCKRNLCDAKNGLDHLARSLRRTSSVHEDFLSSTTSDVCPPCSTQHSENDLVSKVCPGFRNRTREKLTSHSDGTSSFEKEATDGDRRYTFQDNSNGVNLNKPKHWNQWIIAIYKTMYRTYGENRSNLWRRGPVRIGSLGRWEGQQHNRIGINKSERNSWLWKISENPVISEKGWDFDVRFVL